ncbi:MAG: ChbG/HpnK family deacetylase [Anaerolineaceae bacterium]
MSDFGEADDKAGLWPGLTNRLLGYAAEQKLLILNADDFGMCHDVNMGIIKVLEAGIVGSTSLMVCCPWANEAVEYLRQHPDTHFGVHLTAVGDSENYKIGPCLPIDQVPDLVDSQGHFWGFDAFHDEHRPQALEQMEREFRRQIELVYQLGLQPDHLDWHSIRLNRKPGAFEMMLALAREFKLPLRVFGAENIRKIQTMGLPCNNYDLLDSYLIEPSGQASRYKELAIDLKPGLNEWAVHPGLANPELVAIDPGARDIRQRDTDFWTSTEARQTLEARGVVVIDYSALQPFWKFQEV